MRLNKNQTLETLSQEYSTLVKKLMDNTKIKTPPQKHLNETRKILDEMVNLGKYASYFTKYFNKRRVNALVTLLRHGSTYLHDHDYIIGGYPESEISRFVADIVIATAKPPEYKEVHCAF